MPDPEPEKNGFEASTPFAKLRMSGKVVLPAIGLILGALLISAIMSGSAREHRRIYLSMDRMACMISYTDKADRELLRNAKTIHSWEQLCPFLDMDVLVERPGFLERLIDLLSGKGQ